MIKHTNIVIIKGRAKIKEMLGEAEALSNLIA